MWLLAVVLAASVAAGLLLWRIGGTERLRRGLQRLYPPLVYGLLFAVGAGTGGSFEASAAPRALLYALASAVASLLLAAALLGLTGMQRRG